jgi:aspartyl-tRNA(Asn)/glutamyl-tRNA(Gln) amidotransferase subunit A
LKASLTYSAVDYLKAMRVRTQVQAAFRSLLAEVDLLIAPTSFNLPERAHQPFPEDEPKRPAAHSLAVGLIPASNLCGLPAISIPCGFVNGLPIGLQIVGGPFSENRVLAFAREFQNRTDFHKRRPPEPAV